MRMSKSILAATAVCCAAAAQSRTVALWPIQRDVIEGADNLRSAVDPQDDMTLVNAIVVDKGVDWILPPNPDSDTNLLFACRNARAVRGSGRNQQLYSAMAGRHLVTTNAFTIEGFVRMNGIPAVNGQGMLFISAESVGSPYNLSVNLWRGKKDANDEAGNILTWRMTASNRDSELGDVADWESFTNGWHHFAMTHTWANNQSSYTFYWDGAVFGTATRDRNITNDEKNGIAQRAYDLQFLSKANGWYPLNATLDWVRISDESLQPSQFLNYGDAGTLAPYIGSTVAYWPLERRSDGTLDGSPRIGKTALSAGLYDCLGMAANNKPPALSPFLEDSIGGASGSWLAESDGGWWSIAGLGASLETTADFTVTGSLKPIRRHAGAPSDEYVFGTYDGAIGWALRFVKSGNAWQFVLNAVDGSGTYVDDAVLGGDLSDWNDWRKVSLAYAAATGTWTLSLDDATWGAVVNARPPAVSGAADFHFGGYADGANFRGAYDNFSVSSGDAEIANWALDVSDGIVFDGTDSHGNWTYTPTRTAAQTMQLVATSSDSQASVSYPDPSEDFAGDPAVNSGGVAFRSGSMRKRSFLMCSDPEVTTVLTNATGFTVECYVKRTASDNGWFVVFGTAKEISYSSNKFSNPMFLTYRTANQALPGFVFYDDHTLGVSKGDRQFPEANTDELEVGVWHHLALTAYVDPDDRLSRYELFVDGISRGVLTGTGTKSVSAAGALAFCVGGRPSSDQSFPGEMDNVRISRGVLSPSQFLCATSPTHGEAEDPIRTLAAWTPPPASVASVGSRTELDVPFTVEGWIDGSTSVAGEAMPVVGNYSETFSCGWKLSLDRTGATPRLKLVAHGADMSPIIATDFGFDATAFLSGSIPVALEYDPSASLGTWTLIVNGHIAGRAENLYPRGAARIGCHVLKFDEALADGKWRLSRGVLDAEALLYLLSRGTLFLFR